MTDDGITLHPVHRKDTVIADGTMWFWGWLAVDNADRLAIGVITTALDRDDETAAVIQILYCRRYPLGSMLTLHAKHQTSELGAILYRSGEATSKGEIACVDAGLEIYRPQRRVTRIGPPPRPFTPDVAATIGRTKLELAAKLFGVEVIPPKS